MSLERERQLRAYQRAQGYAGVQAAPAAAKETAVDSPEYRGPAGQRQPARTELPAATVSPSEVWARIDQTESSPEPHPVDQHWLQVKLRQLNMPALRLLLVQLPPRLQRILLPQLDKTVAAELLKRARPSQRRELLRVQPRPDQRLFTELGAYYHRLFTREQCGEGKKRLEEICRRLPPEQRRRLGLSVGSEGWQDSASLRRMVQRFGLTERALLLGHPRLGQAVLGLLTPSERLPILAELIRLAGFAPQQRRRRLRHVLSHGGGRHHPVSARDEKKRVGV